MQYYLYKKPTFQYEIFLFFSAILILLSISLIDFPINDINIFSETAKNFKNIKIPSEGTEKLTNGKTTIIHHNIKEDSIILTSRKSLNGNTVGTIVVDIIPNESFTIKSINKNGEIEKNDYSEIFFVIL